MLTLRGEHEGKHDEFIDHTIEGMDTWVSGARSGVICWGFVVLKKPVSMPGKACCGGPCSREAVLPRGSRLTKTVGIRTMLET